MKHAKLPVCPNNLVRKLAAVKMTFNERLTCNFLDIASMCPLAVQQVSTVRHQ